MRLYLAKLQRRRAKTRCKKRIVVATGYPTLSDFFCGRIEVWDRGGCPVAIKDWSGSKTGNVKYKVVLERVGK